MVETMYSNPNQSRLELEMGEDSVSYELLKGHNRTDGSHKTDEQLRSEYIANTDNLIFLMTNGVNVVDPETGKKEPKTPDFVVWLDKSARPVAWLTQELWPVLAADKNGYVPPMPAFRFANIDREQWVNTIDPNGSGYADVELVDESVVRSLRSLFINPSEKRDGLTPDLDQTPTELDGKTVLIVDEVRASGKTLEIAKKFFKRAVPESSVATAHWMKGVAVKSTRGGGQATGNADLPVWYKEKDKMGRGVGNRDERISSQSKSLTQRLGAWFLSSPLGIEDPAALQLRREIHQLAKDVIAHKVLTEPSLLREPDDYEERAVRLNGVGFEDFQSKRLALVQKR